MKALRISLFFFLQMQCFFFFAQKDLKYFLDQNKKFVDSAKATYYVIYRSNPDTLLKAGSIETYFMNGWLLKRVDYKYTADGTKQENETYYYENGKAGSKINTIDLPYEEQFFYYPNGQLRRKAYLKDNTITTESCFTKTGKDTVCYDKDERKPDFPGGLPALNDYIKKNTRYPEEAKRKGLSGTVQIAVIVDRMGGIESLAIQKSVDPVLDGEAMRVIRSMPRWTPGLFRDQALPKYQSLSVVFDLPKK